MTDFLSKHELNYKYQQYMFLRVPPPSGFQCGFRKRQLIFPENQSESQSGFQNIFQEVNNMSFSRYLK